MQKMINFRLPYGSRQLEFGVDESRLNGVITSSVDTLEVCDGTELVRKALMAPIGSPRLSELARGKKKIVIIASDHTRPVPSKEIIPPMLDEIYAGSPDAEVTILIATGFHRPTTEDELIAKFGREIMDRVKIVLHDSRDDSMLVKTGTLPSGGELIINRLAHEADLLVSEGFIEPHFFAGFSGGRKSVLPGIASRKTVFANHCAEFIADKNARTGILENNPIHRDMVYAARHTGLAFIVNVVINSHRRTVAAFAGDMEAAHLAGTEFLSRYCASKPIMSDIVITSNNGAPLDQNAYQAVKGMSCAEATVNEDGIIIMAAECADGVGGDAFHRIFREDRDAASILRRIEAVERDSTEPDQWQAQIFARILAKHKVIFISSIPDRIVNELHMIPAHSVAQAIALADGLLGRRGSVTVIPEGISCIIREQ